MRYAAIIACALLAFPATGLAQAEDVKAEIAAASQGWQAGWNAGDAAAIAAVYTEDAVVMPPGSPAVEGRAAIQAYWQAGLDAAGGATSTLETKEVHAHGDMAVEIGEYMNTNADGEHLDHGKYLAVWMKTDAGWKIVRDIFNSSMEMEGM